MSQKIKFIDIFAGIGGFRKGLTDANENIFECVFSCEIDKNARKTYSTLYNVEEDLDQNKILKTIKACGEKNVKRATKEVFFKDAIQLSDLSSEDLNALISYSQGLDSSCDIPYDLLCAGFPCQPFSRSGKRRAFNDENKGNLFFALRKIIEKTKPKYILLENVKGLLTVGDNQLVDDLNDFGKGLRTEEVNKGRTFYEILETLMNLGYRVEWQVINSADYVAHKRERVYIYAVRYDIFDHQNLFPLNIDDNIVFDLCDEDLLNVKDINFEKFYLKANSDDQIKDMINLKNEDQVFEFGKISPYNNWGRAFIINEKHYIVTAKLQRTSSFNYVLKDILLEDQNIIKKYNLTHIEVLKQIWSKSSKTVSTGNKMGKMRFPDSPARPSRTLTATRTLGREIMVVGYFIRNGKVHYIESMNDPEHLLQYTKSIKENYDLSKLMTRFDNKMEFRDRVEAALNVNLDGDSFDYIYTEYLPEHELEENHLYFRTLTPKEYWLLQGFIDGKENIGESYNKLKADVKKFEDMFEIVKEGELMKQAGNAVTTKVTKVIAEKLLRSKKN